MISAQQHSIPEVIFQAVQDQILSGVLKKGDVISENMIAQEFNVSRTPVREAIKRLEMEGLVEYSNCKTVKVIGISKQDVMDIYDIRLKIESEAMLRASKLMGEKEYNELLEIIDLQEFYYLKGDVDNVRKMDTNFHLRIFEIADSKIYLNLLSTLLQRVKEIRKMSSSSPDRAKKSFAEHRGILEAMKKRDDEEIIRLTNEHINNARENILKIIEW